MKPQINLFNEKYNSRMKESMIRNDKPVKCLSALHKSLLTCSEFFSNLISTRKSTKKARLSLILSFIQNWEYKSDLVKCFEFFILIQGQSFLSSDFSCVDWLKEFQSWVAIHNSHLRNWYTGAAILFTLFVHLVQY